MRDTLVFHRLIATPCFHKHTDAGQRRVVLQRCDHKAVWKLGHLKETRKWLLETCNQTVHIYNIDTQQIITTLSQPN